MCGYAKRRTVLYLTTTGYGPQRQLLGVATLFTGSGPVVSYEIVRRVYLGIRDPRFRPGSRFVSHVACAKKRAARIPVADFTV